MTHVTAVTQKGQITIPKTLRDILGIKPYENVQIEADEGYIKISPTKDILDLAGKFKIKSNKSVLEARKALEKRYQSRV